jgi:hypothetical protein
VIDLVALARSAFEVETSESLDYIARRIPRALLMEQGARGGSMTQPPSHELPPAAERVVQELVDEHLEAWCELIPIDEHTWAIRGSIAYEGEVILAEFDSREDAELALEELAAADPDIIVRRRRIDF